MTNPTRQTQTPKVALITGGSRGLGRSAALKLAEKGVGILLTFHSRDGEANAVVRDIKALGVEAVALRLDTGKVSDFPGFSARIAEILRDVWGRESLDFLVNNAGFGVFKTFAETTEEEFDALMNVHFKGVFFLTQHLLPWISDGGRIINLSTGLARFTMPGHAAYASMKGGVEVLTRYLAKELGPRGIAVNTVAPGAIATDFGGGAVRDDLQLNGAIASSTALGRVGQPDDIGGAIASLLVGENQWVTGQRIEISGGQSL